MANIQIDARQVTYSSFVILGRNENGYGEYNVSKEPQTVQLEAGNYTLSITARPISIAFSVTDQGTIDYPYDTQEDRDQDTFRSGRGTTTLTIKGLPVNFDTTQLSNQIFIIAEPWDDFSPNKIPYLIETRSLNLVPGTYGLRVSNADNGTGSFKFTLKSNGTFSYDANYEGGIGSSGFLRGSGTSSLTFTGYTIQIDARQLSLDQRFGILGGTSEPSLDPKVIQSIKVLPGTFSYQHPYPTDLVFAVSTVGAVTCEDKYRASLTIQGRSLTITGLAVTIDATELFGASVLIPSSQSIEGTKSFRLLPTVVDGYLITYARNDAYYLFGVDTNGHVIYQSKYEISANSGFLSGAGTSTLKISGYPIEIDTSAWQKSSLFIGELEIRPNALTPQTVRLLPQETIKLRVATTPPTELDLSVNADGVLSKIGTYPGMNVLKDGRPTKLVFVQSTIPPNTNGDNFLVKGTIRQSNGKPLVGAIVRAFDKDLISERLLGEQTTNSEGNYSIAYNKGQLSRSDKQQADLIVRVFNTTGEQLIASDIILNAAPLQEINLQLPTNTTLSEWEKITQAVLPLLKGQKEIPATAPGTAAQFIDLPPEELTDSNLDFLIKETQFDREQLRIWILGAKAMRTAPFLQETDFPGAIAWLEAIRTIAPSLAPANIVAWIASYGWFRQGTTTEINTLLNSSIDTAIESLKQAIAKKAIPDLNRPVDPAAQPNSRTGLDIIRTAIQRYQIDIALRPAGDGQPASLGDILRTIPTPLAPDKLRAVASVLRDNSQPQQSLPEKLTSAGLAESEVRSVQRTVGLQSIAQNHLPMIQALQLDQPDTRQAQLRELANLDPANWQQLVVQHGFPKGTVGETDAQKQQVYANQLAQTIETLHPSDWIAYRLPDNRFPIPLEAATKTDLGTFLTQNPQFQMGKTQAVQYFDDPTKPVLTGVADVAKVKEEVLKIERVVNCAPSLDMSGKLLAMGVHSAYAIAQRSEKSFVAEVSTQHPEMAEQAQATYRQATSTHAAATAIATEYIRAERGIPFAIMNPPTSAAGAGTSNITPAPQIGNPGTGLNSVAADQLTANLRSLFGNLDFCTCEYCSSVYSPAAYLVDLMNLLDGSKTIDGRPSLSNLLARRPDLYEIDLTCENANISVPYIDLVLEVLENAVDSVKLRLPTGQTDDYSTELNNNQVPQLIKEALVTRGFSINADARITPSSTEGSSAKWVLRQAGLKVLISQFATGNGRFISVALHPQTSGTTTELSAVPSFINPQPYNDRLRNAVHPWSLPFDLWREETRVWLGQLGVDRSTLMKAFIKNNRYTDLNSAAEFLGFTQSEVARMTTDYSNGWLLWGFGPEAVSAEGMVSPQSIPDPIAGRPLVLNAPTLWIDVLKQRVSLIHHRAQLTQRELMNLVELEFFQFQNVEPPVKLQIEGDECDASLMSIPNLSKGSLLRIHIFIRLWRKLGWSMFDVDRAIQAIPQLNERTFTNEFLIEIANIEQLRQRLGIPIGILLNWYSRKLNSQAYVDYNDTQPRTLPSPYESLFYDRAVARPKDAAFELNTGRTEVIPPVPLATIRSKLSLVAAALSVKPTEIEALLPKVVDTISLQEITQLTDGIAIDITGATTSSSAIIELDLREIRGTGASFTIRLQHASTEAPTFIDIPTENLANAGQPASITEANLKQPLLLRFAYNGTLNLLRAVVTEATGTDPTTNPPRLRMTAKILLEPAVVRDDLSVRNLSTLSRYTSMAKALGLSIKDFLLAKELIGMNPFGTAAATLSFIDRFQQIRSSGFSIAELDYLLRHNSLERSGIDLSKPKAGKILTEIRQSVQQLQPDAVSQVLASKLSAVIGVDTGTTSFLLGKLKYTGKSIAEIFLDTVFTGSDLKVAVNPEQFVAQFRALELMHKVGLMISRWSVTPDQVTWLFDSTTWLNLLDFSQLPLEPKSDNSLFFPWINLLTLLQLRDRLPGGVAALTKIAKLIDLNPVATANWDNFQNAVADILNWSSSDFKLLLGSEGLRFIRNATEDDFKQPQTLMQLANCLDIIRKLGGTAELAIAWKKPLLAPNDALAARQLVRSRYGQESWYKLAQPIQNKLRQMRRRALLDYLIATTGVRDSNDLFGRFLIDPEMGDCMMTTRILQASSTVQLFVHRCLMGLEPEVPASAVNKDRWKWMKNYRVWEANRKVFLYPENWIEPELRDDKSPFFKDLESELLQGDITSEKAGKALSQYLEKVDEVARLEVIGIYRDTPQNMNGEIIYGLETLYVFARTYSAPHKYFYRSYHKLGFNPSGGYWKAWGKIDLDIEGISDLYPIIFQKRLYLFWLTFAEKAIGKLSAESMQGKPSEAKKFWDIRFAWSKLVNGKWQAKQLHNPNWPDNFSEEKIQNLSSTAISQEKLTLNISNEGYYDNPYFSLRYSDIGKADYGWGKYLYFDSYGFKETKFLPGLPPPPPPPGTIWVDTSNSLNYNRARIRWDSSKLPNIYLGSTLSFADDLAAIFETEETSLFRPYQTVRPHQDQYYKNDLEFRAPSKLYSNDPGSRFATYPSCFFISDNYRNTFFVTPYKTTPFYSPFEGQNLEFAIFYHPQIQKFQKTLRELSISGLLKLNLQTDLQSASIFNNLKPSPRLISSSIPLGSARGKDFPEMDVDFSSSGAYSQYNWELFFHLPFIVATHLTKNQRFEEARQWFHYIFDPTDSSSDSEPQRFWRFRPFHEKSSTTPIQTLARILADPNDNSVEKQEFKQQVQMWLENPFKPHAVARFRNRAYMFSVVMKYLDNLIAWGDQLFRRDTRESLNEAAQIYVLAAQILGRRPESIPRRTGPEIRSFGDIRGQLDALSNVQVKAESLLPSNSVAPSDQVPPIMSTLLFCVPENQKILDYYDKVADRLYKIRNCMNIDGVVRQLALFDPPINPAVLVQAAAAGIDLNATLSDLAASPPLYRFNVMSQKATELCSEVKSMGGALLAALEKRDGEAMALLRSKHEIALLQHQRQVKEYQLEEAKANIEALAKSLESAQTRMTYYVGLVSVLENLQIPSGPVEPQAKRLISATLETLSKTAGLLQVVVAAINPLAASGYELLKQALSRAAEALDPSLAAQNGNTNKVPMIAAEKAQLDELKQSHDLQQKGKDYQAVAQLLAKIPDITLGVQGFSSSPVVQAQIGGSLLSTVALAQANEVDYQSGEHAYRANLHSILAGYQRRAADWLHQAKLAQIDIEQISKQGIAAAIRLKMAAEEIAINDRQVANSQEVDEFMQSKYTNQELYDWMVGQISGSYFQSYQLAYDVAKRAEKAYRFELGTPEAEKNFIQFGYWDSLKKGLLAGDRLYHDLKRMEVEYLQQNHREFELTKHLSLTFLDPLALVKLRETGSCLVNLPEEVFDLDYPGHYFRRIKSVSITLPCVVGPYTTISCTLRLSKNSIRINTANGNQGYPRNIDGQGLPAADDRFHENNIPVEAIAASSAQNDSGVFELSFRDDRYLPFEGAGAISQWSLELFHDSSPNNSDFGKSLRQFNYDTISDAILHIKYTAREDAGDFKNSAISNLKKQIDAAQTLGSVRLFSIRHEFPTEWAKFKSSKIQGATQTAELTLNLRAEHYPFWSQGRLNAVKQTNLFAKTLKDTVEISSNADGTGSKDSLAKANLGDLRIGKLTNIPLPAPIGSFTLYFKDNSMDDLWITLTWGNQN